jgi:hypothetical protein
MGTTTNTTVTSFFQSVRIKKIRIFSPPPSQGSVATCSVEFSGTSSSFGSQEISDTSNSVAQPAMIDTAPPRNSLASFWSSAGNVGQLAVINCPSGSIVDLTVDLILSDDDQTNPTRAVSTAVIGTVYYLALDNGTGHVLVPTSLTTTF